MRAITRKTKCLPEQKPNRFESSSVLLMARMLHEQGAAVMAGGYHRSRTGRFSDIISSRDIDHRRQAEDQYFVCTWRSEHTLVESRFARFVRFGREKPHAEDRRVKVRSEEITAGLMPRR